MRFLAYLIIAIWFGVFAQGASAQLNSTTQELITDCRNAVRIGNGATISPLATMGAGAMGLNEDRVGSADQTRHPCRRCEDLSKLSPGGSGWRVPCAESAAAPPGLRPPQRELPQPPKSNAYPPAAFWDIGNKLPRREPRLSHSLYDHARTLHPPP
jgi:hypothetical protein